MCKPIYLWTLILLLLATIAAVAAPCLADPPQSKPAEGNDSAELQNLIFQLDDPDPAVRNAAQRELATFGNDALPLLEEAAHGNSPEIRTRARVAIQRIKSPARETRITLHLNNVTARDALDALEKQSGYQFVPAEPRLGIKLDRAMVSVNCKRQLLLAALLPICEAAELQPVAMGRDQNVVHLADTGGTWSARYTVVQGPYAVSLTKLSRRVHIQYGVQSDPSPVPIELSMLVVAEPRVPVQALTNIRISKCEDETGFPIAADPAHSFNATEFPNTSSVSLHPEGGKKIGVLEGQAVIRLQQEPQRIEVAQVQKSHGQIEVVGALRMSFRDCQAVGPGTWRIRVDILRDGREPEEMAAITSVIAASRPKLVDASGREFDLQVQPRATDTKDFIELDFRFTGEFGGDKGPPSAPAKLVWDVPTRISEVTIPFQFKDVPLP